MRKHVCGAKDLPWNPKSRIQIPWQPCKSQGWLPACNLSTALMGRNEQVLWASCPSWKGELWVQGETLPQKIRWRVIVEDSSHLALTSVWTHTGTCTHAYTTSTNITTPKKRNGWMKGRREAEGTCCHYHSVSWKFLKNNLLISNEQDLSYQIIKARKS